MKNIIVVLDVAEFEKRLHAEAIKGKIKNFRAMVMTPDTFAQIFTPERIRLLQRVKINKIQNIYQLAKELKKPYEVVFKNLKYLEGYGLVKFENKNNKKIPHLAHEIKIELFPKLAEA